MERFGGELGMSVWTEVDLSNMNPKLSAINGDQTLNNSEPANESRE